jgi:glycosyltransferase involved in cell wall biosynthesis
MRILLVTPAYYPSSFGGVKNYTTILSRKLANLGHEVSVYTSNAYNFKKNLDLRGEHIIKNVRVIYFKNYFPKRYWHTPGVIWRILKERKKFDVIHLNNNFGYINFIVYLVAKAFNIPIIFSAHGSLTVRFRNYFIKSIYNKLITINILKYASKVIAFNKEEANQYLEMKVPMNKIEIVPIGINLKDFSPLLETNDFRERYNILKKEIAILFIGRIHFIKGIEYIIRAVKKISDSGYSVKFLVVGPDFGHLEKLKKIVLELNIGKQVLFVGPLYGKEKVKALYGSDVFVLPSLSESFGIVALEAGYCGLPLVLSEGVSLSREIKEKAALVVPLDVNKFSEVLKKLIDDRALRLRLGKKAKAIIKEKYNSDLIAEKVFDIYKSVVKNKKK